MEDQGHGNQYRIDLRQFMSGRPAIASPQFSSFIPHPSSSLPTELFPCHSSNLQTPPTHQHHNYDLMMFMPRSIQEFHGDSSAAGVAINPTNSIACATATNAGHGAVIPSAATSSSCLPHALIGSSGMVEGEAGCCNAFGGGGAGSGDVGGTGRWPRQETLTLLEIRSSLDSKFKEANQKGPLWEEVSRIMAEEHGYQRSAKKCREKFENLYKYYKKTKEGKAGRQDGKHYRFFRQLEALYGESSIPTTAQESPFVGNAIGFQQGASNASHGNFTLDAFHSQKHSRGSLSISESMGCDSSSDEDDQSTGTIGENDSADRLRRKKRSARTWKLKIKEFLDVQMRKLMERQEAWLLRLTNTLEEKEKERLKKEDEWRKREAERVDREHKFWAKEREWIEARDAALMEALQNLAGREVNIPSPEGMLGIRDQAHNQNDNSLNIQDGNRGGEFKEGNKKRKENSRNSGYFLSYESVYHPGEGGTGYCEINGKCENNGPSPANSNAGNTVNDSCFRFLMSGNEGENVWVAKEINDAR